MTDKAGRYVESIDVTTGTIQIVYGKDANSKINNQQLAIQPYVNVNGDVVWRCGAADAPDRADAVPSTGSTASAAGTTDLSDKHMPASCRSGFGGDAAS